MKLICTDAEFRTLFSKTGQKGIFYIGTFEDSDGMPFEVFMGNKKEDLPLLEKGHKYDVLYDYNTYSKYLNFVGIL